MLEQLWSGLIGFTQPYIVPDWGSLIQLLPVMLAAVVLLYLTWTLYRLATAPPTRRGIQRLPPKPPAGVHMPGPSFAPLLAAFGAFAFMAGVLFSGVWLFVGLGILVVTLLYWGNEAIRDYDRIPRLTPEGTASGMVTATAAGALPTPAGEPPEGVHMPPPSFRPLLLAIAMTMFVGGMVFGGWALLIGALAIIVTGLGWLRDARREYLAVERADRTGHLDLGGAPSWPKATFAALAVILAIGLLLGSGVLPNSNPPAASGAPGASGAAGGGGTPASAAPSLPAADANVAAQNIAYTPTTISAPAGKAFTLAFDNRDTVPHNVDIKDASGKEVFKGDIVTGPKVTVYQVPALAAGQYSFVCSVHPSMTGTLTAK